MTKIYQSLLAQTTAFEPPGPLEIIIMFFFLIGAGILFFWLVGPTSPGTLKQTSPRRNYLHFMVPIAVIAVWILLMAAGSVIAEPITSSAPAKIQDLATFVMLCIIEIAMGIWLLVYAKKKFARGLKGFGLNPRKIPEDFLIAFLNYLAAAPLVAVGINIVILVGKFLSGSDFQIEQNEGLVVLTENDSLLAKSFIVFTIVLVVPFFEEIVFRGYLQSTLRAWTLRPWAAIFVASVIFTALHPSTHWLALFFLSMVMGYAYERSGSLFRSIFIHMLFNGINVTFVLLNIF